ncbi:hypothetical protein PTTG_30110 [Puccinia triticina 1-1 BBBD Race 1]|uniref:Uncharacterized protein n=1 Tax=Puccinia triticina (isolate 1-1 / race 1 (BBBD)) TaxID=630390 RepID=A0A180G035_PUCT1|nr:hypothetical protein PTTG_30110 [Puccinia triticina 1-1 BBBD Race 1]
MSYSPRNTHSPPSANNPWIPPDLTGIQPAAFATNNRPPSANDRRSSSRPDSTPRNNGPIMPGLGDGENRAPGNEGPAIYTEADVARFLQQAQHTGRTVGQNFCDASARLTDAERLKPDGSNFTIWDLFLRERAREFFVDHLWFTKPNPHLADEQLGRSLLLATVDSGLIRLLLKKNTAYEMYDHLRSRFNNITRAEQLLCWEKLKNFKLADHASSSEAMTRNNSRECGRPCDSVITRGGFGASLRGGSPSGAGSERFQSNIGQESGDGRSHSQAYRCGEDADGHE